MKRTITLYLVNVYEAYRADEQGVQVMTSEPVDTIYYKHEVLKSVEAVLPEGVEYDEQMNTWSVNGNSAELYWEDGKVSLISAEGFHYLCDLNND